MSTPPMVEIDPYFWIAGSYLLTLSLKLLPAVNFPVFEAALLRGSLVFGLLPVRAARAPVENEPKPISWTVSAAATA
jgi:hypothetical protein